jgi:hypothetical protein
MKARNKVTSLKYTNIPTLKMEASRTTEAFVNLYLTTSHKIDKDNCSQHRECFKKIEGTNIPDR